MAVAHDAQTRFPATENTADTTAGDRSFTHTPTGTPKGVVIAICSQTTGVPVTGVTYGGKRCRLAANAIDSTEAGATYIYVLEGVAIPTGAQTVVLEGASTSAKFCTVSTVTASTTHTRLYGPSTLNTQSSANPQVTILNVPAGGLCYGAIHTGAAAPSASPLSGVTLQNNRDYGALAAQTVRQTTAAGSTGNVTIGVTLGADDWCMAAVALVEHTPPNGTALAEQPNITQPVVGNNGAGGLTVTTQARVIAGANRLMVIHVHGEGNGTTDDVAVDSIQWAGTNFAEFVARQGGPNWSWTEVWVIHEADGLVEGINNLIVTLTASDIVGVAIFTFDGGNQTEAIPVADVKTQNGSSTSASQVVTNVASTDILQDSLTLDATGHTISDGADQASWYSQVYGTACQGYGSRQLGSAGGVMSVGWTGSGPFSYIAYRIKQFGGGNTYSKANTLSAGGTVPSSSPQSVERAETGAMVSTTRAFGADVSERAEAGSIRASGWLSGPSGRGDILKTGVMTAAGRIAGAVSFVASLTGELIGSALGSGVSAKEQGGKSGSLIAGSQLSGVDVSERTEVGALIAAALIAAVDTSERTESGALLSSGRLSGIDVAERTEAGALVADTLLVGPDIAEYAEAGSLRAAAVVAGTDIAERTESGALVADTLLAGISIKESPGKAGSLLASARVAGVDAVERNELGSLRANALSAGADISERAELGALITRPILTGADIREAAETGSLRASALSSGLDASERVEAALVAAQSLLRGADSATMSELGSLIADTLISGVSVKEGAGKSGTLSAGARTSGIKVREYSEQNFLAAQTFGAGIKSFTVTKSGVILAGGSLYGADVHFATKTGSLVGATSITAFDAHEAARAGSIMAGALLSAISELIRGFFTDDDNLHILTSATVERGRLTAAGPEETVIVATVPEKGKMTKAGF